MFDLVVMVDWSASTVPSRGRDSIWAASLDLRTGAASIENHVTRHLAREALRASLCAAVDRRVLVGVDFPLGYPAGTASALGLGGMPWRSMWRHLCERVIDTERNRNNRFEVAADLNLVLGGGPGPWWGCPSSAETATLSMHKQHAFPFRARSGAALAEFRLAERTLQRAGRRPFSVWQMAYAGSVGGQALVGIPVLDDLIHDPQLATRVEVWPFTTGLGIRPTFERRDTIVFAEVWPGAIEVDLARHPVRDAAQVLALCDWIASAERDGSIGALFDAPSLSTAARRAVVTEEGWILGVGAPR